MQLNMHAIPQSAQSYIVLLPLRITPNSNNVGITGEEDETSTSQSKGSRFPISKDDAVTIAIALAASTLIRT